MKKNKRKVPLSMTPEVKQFTKELEDNGFEIVKKTAREDLMRDVKTGVDHIKRNLSEIKYLRKANYEQGLRLRMFDDTLSLLRDKGQNECGNGRCSNDPVQDSENYVALHS